MQSAAIVLKHSDMLEVGNVKAQTSGVSRDTPRSAKDVAKEAGVSKGTVDRTKKAIALDPDKVDEIIEGKVTPTEIIQEHKAKAKAEQDIVVVELASTASDSGAAGCDCCEAC